MHKQNNSHAIYTKLTTGFLTWVLCLAVILAGSGIWYALLKNQQVIVRNQIEKINKEIAVKDMNANHYRAQVNEQSNRWALLDRLHQEQSNLRPIARIQTERYQRSGHQNIQTARLSSN